MNLLTNEQTNTKLPIPARRHTVVADMNRIPALTEPSRGHTTEVIELTT